MGEVGKLKGEQHECNKCGHVGPDDDFRTPHRKGKDGHLYYDLCKPCHIEGARSSRYKVLYNITVEEYEKILVFQKGRCAICGRPQKDGQKRLAVDHCHRSGLIRGLLCWACNKALGAFKDDQWRMWKAFFYLFAPPAIEALGEERYGMLGRIKKKAKNRMLGNADIEQGLYKIRCSPDEFIQALKLKAVEINDAKERKKCENAKSKTKGKPFGQQTSVRRGDELPATPGATTSVSKPCGQSRASGKWRKHESRQANSRRVSSGRVPRNPGRVSC